MAKAVVHFIQIHAVPVKDKAQPPAPFGGLAPDFPTVTSSGAGLERQAVEVGQTPLLLLELGEIPGQAECVEVAFIPAHDLERAHWINTGKALLLAGTGVGVDARRNEVQIVDEFPCRLLFLIHNRLNDSIPIWNGRRSTGWLLPDCTHGQLNKGPV